MNESRIAFCPAYCWRCCCVRHCCCLNCSMMMMMTRWNWTSSKRTMRRRMKWSHAMLVYCRQMQLLELLSFPYCYGDFHCLFLCFWHRLSSLHCRPTNRTWTNHRHRLRHRPPLPRLRLHCVWRVLYHLCHARHHRYWLCHCFCASCGVRTHRTRYPNPAAPCTRRRHDHCSRRQSLKMDILVSKLK